MAHEILEHKRARYRWYKEHGICPNCGQNEAAPGTVICASCKADRQWSRSILNRSSKCRETDRIYHQKRFERLRKAGLCLSCGKVKAETGLVYCRACRDRKNALNRKYRKKAKYNKIGIPRGTDGTCVTCGAPVKDGYRLCEKHYDLACRNLELYARPALIEKRKHGKCGWDNSVHKLYFTKREVLYGKG